MGTKKKIRFLDETELGPDPIDQFRLWYEEAERSGVEVPEAMALATATPDGAPSVRVVLLRGLDARGFVFYTNYQSRKGDELQSNPRAAAVFYWKRVRRQVRVEGTVERTTPEESAQYFDGRPRDSQLGAWASEQSAVVPSRGSLLDRFGQVEKRFAGEGVPCPPFWGGYRILPRVIEFWQEQRGRLHDRIRYTQRDGRWVKERLSP